MRVSGCLAFQIYAQCWRCASCLHNGRLQCRVRFAQIFLSSKSPDRLGGPPSLLLSGYFGLTSQGYEANHKLPCNAEVENEWSCPLLPYIPS